MNSDSKNSDSKFDADAKSSAEPQSDPKKRAPAPEHDSDQPLPADRPARRRRRTRAETAAASDDDAASVDSASAEKAGPKPRSRKKSSKKKAAKKKAAKKKAARKRSAKRPAASKVSAASKVDVASKDIAASVQAEADDDGAPPPAKGDSSRSAKSRSVSDVRDEAQPKRTRRKRAARKRPARARETTDMEPESDADAPPPRAQDQASGDRDASDRDDGSPRKRSRRSSKSAKSSKAKRGRSKSSRGKRREGAGDAGDTEADAPMPGDDAGAEGERPAARSDRKRGKRTAERRPRRKSSEEDERRRGRRGRTSSSSSSSRMRDTRALDIVPHAPSAEDRRKERVLLVNATDREEARIALLVDGVLEEIYVEAVTEKSVTGNVYRGRIQNVERGIGAAFVDIGRGVTGFLHATDMPTPTDPELAEKDPIDRLVPGDEVIVQITRDSIGRKGPALTGRISLPGRYLVLMPFTDRSGISRRIPQGRERERVRKLLRTLELPEGMGIIVRTASETTDLAALEADRDHLLGEWERIRSRGAEPGGPGVLRGESDLAERSVRDIMPGEVARIVVDVDETAGQIHRLLRIWYPSETAAAEAVGQAHVRAATAAADVPLGEIENPGTPTEEDTGGFAPEVDVEPGEEPEPEPLGEEERMAQLEVVARAMPEVELHTDPMPLFHVYNVETQLEDAFRRTIRLPSGGSIVIDPTEALVAIDVNSGRLTDAGDPERTALVTNLEAVKEAARQLRLRDLGGLVVLDFIDMRESKSRREVERAFRDALSFDRARIRLGRMGPFGLMVLSRQRIRRALTRVTHEECVICGGTGRRRHVPGLGLRILREMHSRVARSRGRGGLEVRAPAEVCAWIRKHRGNEFRKIKNACQGPVSLETDDRLARDGWAMKGITQDEDVAPE